jgi:hypothetical protein
MGDLSPEMEYELRMIGWGASLKHAHDVCGNPYTFGWQFNDSDVFKLDCVGETIADFTFPDFRMMGTIINAKYACVEIERISHHSKLLGQFICLSALMPRVTPAGTLAYRPDMSCVAPGREVAYKKPYAAYEEHRFLPAKYARLEVAGHEIFDVRWLLTKE